MEKIRIHTITDTELEKLQKKRDRWAGVISTGAAALSGLIVVILAVPQESTRSVQHARTELDSVQTSTILSMRRQIDQIQNEQQAMAAALRNSPGLVRNDIILGKINDLSRRQGEIEKVIINNPIKALELPMLRNDINNMRDVNNQQLESIRTGVQQAYDINKWLLGTMGITIFGLALSNLLIRKKPEGNSN